MCIRDRFLDVALELRYLHPFGDEVHSLEQGVTLPQRGLKRSEQGADHPAVQREQVLGRVVVAAREGRRGVAALCVDVGRRPPEHCDPAGAEGAELLPGVPPVSYTHLY